MATRTGRATKIHDRFCGAGSIARPISRHHHPLLSMPLHWGDMSVRLPSILLSTSVGVQLKGWWSPMAKPKNVLRDIHLGVETAVAPRICSAHRTGAHAHKIHPGQLCLVVTEDRFKRNYCPAGAARVLDLANNELTGLQLKLVALRRQLGV